MMRSHLRPSLILLAAALGSVMGNSDVEEISRSYSCCELKISYDADCENTWRINNGNFALSKTNECIPPCVGIQDGEMTLDRCVAFDAIVVCKKLNVTEQRINFTYKACAGSGIAPGNQGSVGSVLLALLIGGWFVKHIC